MSLRLGLFRRALSTIPEGAAQRAAQAGASASTTAESSTTTEAQAQTDAAKHDGTPRGRAVLYPVSLKSMRRTAPRDVRERRAQFPKAQKKSPLVQPGAFTGKDAERWPEVLEKQFQALRKRGQWAGDETSARKAFLRVNQEWRSRLRGGVTVVDAEGKPTADNTKMQFLRRKGRDVKDVDEASGERMGVVGQKVFLPNVVVKLVRNNTKPGQAYDPWVATFRIPPSMTKLDLRSYLSAVYGLEVSFIRTELRVGTVIRNKRGQKVREGGASVNYKRAVVGLYEPFHYPDDVEEMRAGTWGGKEWGELQAQKREEMLNSEFLIDGSKDFQKVMMLKILKGQRWRGNTANSGNIIRELARRRAEREAAISRGAANLYLKDASAAVDAADAANSA